MTAPTVARPDFRREVAILAVASACFSFVRLLAAGRVGFGDSEALYAAYALHPQPAYLDHPGLIGAFARAIGAGTSPTPEQAHQATAVLATVFPWAMAALCRACGASWRRSFATAIVVAFVPELAIGLFAMTPDLLLSLSWVAALATAAVALRGRPGSGRSALAFSAAGLLAGIAASSKVSGVLLLVGLAMAYATRAARAHARTLAPWAGLAAGGVVLVPIAAFEAHAGWPLLRHRLVDTQSGAGFAWVNLAALVGGQLAYLSPLVALLVVPAARALWRGRRDRDDPVGALLFASSVVPAAVLVPLCLWSRVAEPHWVAPALLALAPALARAPVGPSRRYVVVSTALAGAIVAAVHAWVLVPQALRLAPASYDARLDLANELHGWPEFAAAVREEVMSQSTPGSSLRDGGDVVVVGPHWIVCAQIEVGLRELGLEVRVGCDTPIRDDYDDWWPRRLWRQADSIVWVTDERFGPPPLLPFLAPLRTRQVRIERGSRVTRTFTIAVLTRRASG
jgi:hypothetical protein